MQVFLSWSGSRSQALANALNEWLKPILHYVEPWCSTSDIQSGDRWGNEIAKVLQETKFGILCVTSDNLSAPWLLFEAGALAKSIDDSRVIPLLLDLEKSDLAGPLTQFQAEKADKEGVKRLAESLNKASAAPITGEMLNTLFEALWPQLEAKIAAIPATSGQQKKPRPQAEVLEELVTGVRTVEMRMRDIFEGDAGPRRRRSGKVPAGMLMELRQRLTHGLNDPLNLLISGSAVKDDFPWIYELALEAYRAVKEGDLERAAPSILQFKEALHTLMRGPYLDYLVGDNKATYLAVRDALEFFPHFEDVDGEEANARNLRKKRISDQADRRG